MALALALSCLSQPPSSQVWPPAVASSATVRDLHREYSNIFRHGNRNAASHLWASFLLDRASSMSTERFELMFSGFCAVSGSPVQPSDYTRYRLTLPLVAGGQRSGYMYYCCWPCVCDTQDFIRVDTKNVTTAAGERQYHFAVLGNPCEHREKLREPFTQPFERRGPTTLEREAAEVKPNPNPNPILALTQTQALSLSLSPVLALFLSLALPLSRCDAARTARCSARR